MPEQDVQAEFLLEVWRDAPRFLKRAAARQGVTIRSSHAMADLQQELVVRVMRSRCRADWPERFGFVRRVAAHLLVDWLEALPLVLVSRKLRTARRVRRARLIDYCAPSPLPRLPVGVCKWLNEALATLPDEQEEMVRLAYGLDCQQESLSGLARRYGVPLRTLRGRLARAVQWLRRVLTEDRVCLVCGAVLLPDRVKYCRRKCADYAKRHAVDNTPEVE